MKVIMYTTHCPQCEVLSKKLNQKSISYIEVEDREIMAQMGITTVPALSINGAPPMTFKQAIDWINSLEV